MSSTKIIPALGMVPKMGQIKVIFLKNKFLQKFLNILSVFLRIVLA